MNYRSAVQGLNLTIGIFLFTANGLIIQIVPAFLKDSCHYPIQ